MSFHSKKNYVGDLEVLRKILRYLIASYTIGWGLLAWFAIKTDLIDDQYWRVSAIILLGLTIWLVVSLNIRSLWAWVTGSIVIVTVRSISYASEGIFAPFGVWMLVMSGVSITGLAVISVNAVTGRLHEDKR